MSAETEASEFLACQQLPHPQLVNPLDFWAILSSQPHGANSDPASCLFFSKALTSWILPRRLSAGGAGRFIRQSLRSNRLACGQLKTPEAREAPAASATQRFPQSSPASVESSPASVFRAPRTLVVGFLLIWQLVLVESGDSRLTDSQNQPTAKIIGNKALRPLSTDRRPTTEVEPFPSGGLGESGSSSAARRICWQATHEADPSCKFPCKSRNCCPVARSVNPSNDLFAQAEAHLAAAFKALSNAATPARAMMASCSPVAPPTPTAPMT